MKANSDSSSTFDFIVVGGGSAGCVLASRLSEDATKRVLLVEAGPDHTNGEELPAIADTRSRAIFKNELFWPNFMVQGNGASERAPERIVPFLQAKLLGGGSSINGMHAQRGFPRDYAEWKDFGVTDWGWDDVLPYFVKLESDEDFNGPHHGKDGPISIRRVERKGWSTLSVAVEADQKSRGLAAQKDLNLEFGDGVGPVPLNISDTTRVSSARGYLRPEVRSRSNLEIWTETEVHRVAVEDGRAVGIDIMAGTGTRRITAREVIVSCGAIHSPALLQRSGIGPAAALQALGIPVVADRPGVGKNLSNHPMFSISAHLRAKARCATTEGPPGKIVVRYSSNVASCPSTDMILNLWERVPSPHLDDPLGRQMADIMFILNKPFSRGEVLIDSADPSARPGVRFNMFEDERDLARFVAAYRYCVSILNAAAVKPLINAAFILKPIPMLFAYLGDSPRGRMVAKLGGALLGISERLAAKLLRRWTIPLDTVPDRDDDIVQLIRSSTLPGGHPTGTCRMGRRDDPHAVVDTRGRVIGVEGLRVADPSIFPTIVTAGTNIPAMMVGEKIASHIKRQDN